MRKFLSTALVISSISLLAACGANDADDNNNGVEPKGVNFSPVNYDRYDNRGILNNDRDPNGNFLINDNDDDNRINMGNDYRDNRGLDLDFDSGNRNIRQPGEMDTPFNMDEEEPDLDEEPSEQLRNR